MKHSWFVAALLAVALSACSKKEEATATSAAPTPAAPVAQPTPAAVPAAAANDAATTNATGRGLKLANVPPPDDPPGARRPVMW